MAGRKGTTTQKRKRRVSTGAAASPRAKERGIPGTAGIGGIIPTKHLSDVRISVIRSPLGRGSQWGLEARQDPSTRFPHGWRVQSRTDYRTQQGAAAALAGLLDVVESATTVAEIERWMEEH